MPAAEERFFYSKDVHLLCYPRSRFRHPEPWSRLRAIPKQDVGLDRISIVAGAARAGLCAPYASGLPDRSASERGLDDRCAIGYHLFPFARGTETL